MRSAMVEALTLTTEPDGTAAQAAVWSSGQWVEYFRHNADNLLSLPWESGVGASAEELATVLGSLRAWQLGETSDGRQLTASAVQYASETGDPAFVEAIRLFIAEEQRHGETLGQFLDLAGVPRKTWDWGDAIFRVFRHFLSRIESWAAVVLMVEVHALVYYAAVRRATPSPLLRRICSQLLRDEVPHIRFQCERLATIRHPRGRVRRTLTAGVERILFAGVTVAIWAAHRGALRAGGLSLRRFWSLSWGRMTKAWRAADPHGYRW